VNLFDQNNELEGQKYKPKFPVWISCIP